MATDYKTKYMDIRSKLKEATDVAYRLGYEQGMKDGTQAAQMQAMAQQQQQQSAMMGSMGGQPGQEQGGMPPEAGEMPPEAGGAPADEQAGMMGEETGDEGQGSELDQHIGELESLVSKGEKPTVLSIRKAVEALAHVRKSQKNAWAKKVEKIIPAQKAVVDNILKKWQVESQKPSEGLDEIIKLHGLKVE